MKFKHLLLTASVMALFSSCSNDELVNESTSHGDAIAFSVTTNNATRAADYWCNANKPSFFHVSASYNGAFYFKDDLYKLSEGKWTPQDGNYRYWPDIYPAQGTVGSEGYVAGKSLNVYAYKVNAETADALGDAFATFSWTAADAAPTISMTPKTKAAEQRDLLYAYTQVFNKPTYGATADINFRHALSQIVFYAKCENTKVYVEIEEIALMNAATSGTFTLPTGTNTTNDNLENHAQAGEAKTTGLGTWALNYTRTGSTPNRSYTASCTKVVDSKTVLTALTPGNTGWTNLTDNTAGSGTGESAVAETNYGQSLLVLPQTTYTGEGAADNKLEAYDHTAALGNTGKCACIAIKCKIRNIAGTEVKDNDVYLWGSATEAKDLVVPVDFTWEQGKKYIYRINFSKTGHGGYDPGTGDEVLVPIQLSVTVDDFAKVTDIEKDI